MSSPPPAARSDRLSELLRPAHPRYRPALVALALVSSTSAALVFLDATLVNSVSLAFGQRGGAGLGRSPRGVRSVRRGSADGPAERRAAGAGPAGGAR